MNSITNEENSALTEASEDVVPSIVVKNRRILDLLAQGVSPQQVLNITGASPAYIKALINDETFKAYLEKEAAQYMAEAKEEEIVSSKYLATEHAILKHINEQLPHAEFHHAVRALEVISKRQEAHRQQARTAAPVAANNINIVNISVPTHALPEYILNNNNEVVQVGAKPLSPMPSSAVVDLFQKLSTPVDAIPAP